MTRTRIYLVATSLLLGVGLLLWSRAGAENMPDDHIRPARTAPERPASDDRRYAALRGQVSQLQHQVRDLQESTADPDHGALAEEPSEVVEDEQRPPSDPYAHIEDPIEKDMAIARDLEAFLDGEPVDGEWRVETEAAVTSTVAEVEHAELLTVECRSTMCRAEIVHSGLDERAQAVSDLIMRPPWNTQGFAHMRNTDPPESAIYFARRGHSLPRPNQE